MSKKKEQVVVTADRRKEIRDKIMKMGDKKVGRDIYHMLKSRYRILLITTNEEHRVLDCLKMISVTEGYDIFKWDCDTGMSNAHTDEVISSTKQGEINVPLAALAYIIDVAKSDETTIDSSKECSHGRIFVLFDFHYFLQGDGSPSLVRRLKQFADIRSICTIVMVAPVFSCPPGLEKEVTLVPFPLPSDEEIEETLNEVITGAASNFPKVMEKVQNDLASEKEEIVKAARGLTLIETANAYAKSLVKNKTFEISTIIDEKRQAISKSGIVEYREPRFAFDEVGGLDNLKEWLIVRKAAFKEEAHAYGLPNPKGAMLIGIPGCGKSMTCEAVASVYRMPLLRLDIGAIFSSYIGQSEQNVRSCIQLAETVAPCVTGDSILSLSCGAEISVEDVFNNNQDKGILTTNSAGDVQLVFNEPLRIKTYDPETNWQINSYMFGVVKRIAQPIIKIRTLGGIEIKASYDHQILVYSDDNRFIWRKMRDISIDDYPVTCKSVSVQYGQGSGSSCYENNMQRIVSIEVCDPEPIYDPCCDRPHSYITNGFVNHNCVFWVDEVEKGVSGVQSSSQTDGGVTSRVFGTLLTWMSEKDSPVFVICTANNVEGIPPEFMRAGRFDEVFFLDLPNQDQRMDVLTKLLTKVKRKPENFDIVTIAKKSENYSPAELKKAIESAMFIGYSDNKREITTEDILFSLSQFQPLYSSRREEIDEMRCWAMGKDGKGGRAVLANSTNNKASVQKISSARRTVDLGDSDMDLSL